MAIIVHSPHDGQPVKVRDQDMQRAIRDGEGRIFYAVKRSDDQGYYGALTRKGSDKDERRYVELLEKMQTAREVGKVRSAEQIHDATGKASGPGMLRWVLLLIVAALIAAGAWYLSQPDNPLGRPGMSPDGQEGLPDSQNDESSKKSINNGPSTSSKDFSLEGYVGTASGLRYKILRPGKGDTAVAGRYVLVEYAGKLMSGEAFDRSEPERPVGFILWSGKAPRGWDEGVAGMRVGEKRRLILTPELVCGPYPGNVVLPDGTLCFDIELVGVLPGVRMTTQVKGDGAIARPGDTIRVHYTAYIDRERESYDSTYDRGKPTELRIGTGELIPGWDLGVIGMTEGETRLIEIPPYLGYGQRGAAGIIPPGASLRYTVELLRVKSSTARHAEVTRDQGG